MAKQLYKLLRSGTAAITCFPCHFCDWAAQHQPRGDEHRPWCRPITDFDEVTNHMLECILAHKRNTKGQVLLLSEAARKRETVSVATSGLHKCIGFVFHVRPARPVQLRLLLLTCQVELQPENMQPPAHLATRYRFLQSQVALY